MVEVRKGMSASEIATKYPICGIYCIDTCCNSGTSSSTRCAVAVRRCSRLAYISLYMYEHIYMYILVLIVCIVYYV